MRRILYLIEALDVNRDDGEVVFTYTTTARLDVVINNDEERETIERVIAQSLGNE